MHRYQRLCISTEVRKRLKANAALKFDNIRVEVAHCVVYLYGRVDTRVERDEALASAQVPEASKVVDGLYINNR